MKKLAKRIFVSFLGLLIILLHSNAYAIGEAGAQFLKIGIGARASAMGEAFVGVADDASAIYWNPAGLTQIKSVQLLGMQNFWLMDMDYQYLGVVLPSHYGNLGVAIAYSSSGEIPKYENFQQLGEYTAYDATCAIAYAWNICRAISSGINLKAIQQKIEEEDATGFAADIGLLYKVAKSINIGLTLQNLGPGIKFIKESDPLPQTGKIGIGYHRGPFIFAVDFGKSRDNDFHVNLGGEFLIGNILALRAGYNSANSYSAGLGLTWQKVSIDYAYVPYEDLGDTHRISILMKLGSVEEIPPVVTPPLPPKEVPMVIPEKIPEMKIKPVLPEVIPEEKPRVKPEVKPEIKPEEKPQIKPPVEALPVETAPEVIVPEKQEQVTVIVGEVDVWSGPGNTYERIAAVSKGTKLVLLDDSKRWYYKVLLPDGRIGWICYVFVSK